MKPLLRILLLCLICVTAFPAQSSQPQATVMGQLLTGGSSQPAPGLVVSLVHPQFGRSVPTSSDVYGRFTFFGIPMNRVPYYLEVYWGNQLVYRNTIYVSGDHVNLPPIFL